MTSLDQFVIWTNLAGCLFAVVANIAAAHVGFLVNRALSATIAVVAATYAIGYALLLSGAIEIAKWSAFYRGVSVVVWPLVWAGPALMSMSAWRHTKKEIHAAMEAQGARSDLRG